MFGYLLKLLWLSSRPCISYFIVHNEVFLTQFTSRVFFFILEYEWDPRPLFVTSEKGGGRRLIGISGSLIWSKTLMEQIFDLCGEFRWSPEDPVSQIHSPHLHVGAPGIFSDLSRSVQMLKREWGEESNGSNRTYSIPGETAALVPEFAMEDLPSAELQPKFLRLQWRTWPLGRTLWWWWI